MLLLLPVGAQVLELPARPPQAMNGTEFVKRITPLGLADREREIIAQVAAGNVPGFLRKLCPVQASGLHEGSTNTATFYVTPDYLAVGSDDDYFLAPLSPGSAQIIADLTKCCLPTPKMVDDIYSAAEVKLEPWPIPASAAMTTVPVFGAHNATVRLQRAKHLPAHPLGALVAGHQKDVVVCAKLTSAPGKVAIYGWHRSNGVPIQPLYLQHAATWVDYSHGIRLVAQTMAVNGVPRAVGKIMADPLLAALLSREGVVANPQYPTNISPQVAAIKAEASTSVKLVEAGASGLAAFGESPDFHERVATFTFEPGVRIHINAPKLESFAASQKVMLAFYALPNGNTTAQTFGKQLKAGDDWHYDIQHIGAQTRFLRNVLSESTVVVAYLENDLKSWPAWRKKYGDQAIATMINGVKKIFAGSKVEVILSGHSGGGSLLFGYLNAMAQIPDDVIRIAFLDANYAYDRALHHDDKLGKWLAASNNHHLCILAYNDAVALLDGRSFVSPEGGTWGKSHAMQADLARCFSFSARTDADFERFSALGGRVQFLLKANPERKVLHTVQVERNGFIHCVLSGTPHEEKGYRYFGPRAYSDWITEQIPE